MTNLPWLLLTGRERFWDQAQQQSFKWRELLPLCGFIILSCAVYGAVMAGWRSPLLCLYVAIKLPLLFLGATALVAVFNWMTATLLGARLTFQTSLFITFSAMVISGWILLGLAPVALFFLFSGVPRDGLPDEVRLAHNCQLVTHIFILAVAGAAGNAALLRGLRRSVPSRCPVGLVFAVWLAAFAFVGCQLSWILRPFVGSPFYPVVFMRPDCLDRNFYEFVFNEVLPFMLTGAK